MLTTGLGSVISIKCRNRDQKEGRFLIPIPCGGNNHGICVLKSVEKILGHVEFLVVRGKKLKWDWRDQGILGSNDVKGLKPIKNVC